MNRRQLIAGIFSAALLRVSTDMGLAKPVIYKPKTIDEILQAEAHRIGQEIYKRTLSRSPWLALMPDRQCSGTHGRREGEP
jgi:hypothetical protein